MRVCGCHSLSKLLCPVRIKCHAPSGHIVTEVAIRVVLLFIYCMLEVCEPFQGPLRIEQLWMYKYPHHGSTVTTPMLIAVTSLIPAAFILVAYLQTRDKNDLIQGLLALSLALVLNGVVTNVIKLSVGRPRPDFFYRCFPDGVITQDLECTGDRDAVSEGRKSFPSGHTSWIFAGFSFLSLYLAGKLQCFIAEGRGQSWRLLAVLLPLLTATVVGLSRVQDNMHHWEDVAAGAILGLLLAFLSYLLHYPSPLSPDCGTPCVTMTDSDSAVLPRSTSSSKIAPLTDIKIL